MSGYGGESNAKKIARALFWLSATDRYRNPNVLREKHALVLAGPDAGDVKALVALGMPIQNITAVDRDKDALYSAKRAAPGAIYICGDVEDVAEIKKNRRKFSMIHLDYCCPISRRTVRKTARIAALGLKDNGVLGTAFMYGREGPAAREDLEEWRRLIASLDEVVRRMSPEELAMCKPTWHPASDEEWIESIRNGAQNEIDSAKAAFARELFLRTLLVEESMSLGYGLILRGCMFYKSVKNPDDLRSGVPMVYASMNCYRPPQSSSRRRLRDLISRQFQNLTPDYMEGFEHLGGDPDGEMLRHFAVFFGRLCGAEAIAALLGVPKGTVAAWMAWETRRSNDAEDPTARS